MRDLTRDEMDEILIAHEKAELEYDIQATMATLAPNPHYEMHFFGLAVDGWGPVENTYARLIKLGGEDRNIQADARVIAEARNVLIREAYVSFDTAEGERVTGHYIVVIEFDPETKKIRGERMYGDTVYAKFMEELLGPDFADQPGVSKLSDSAPIINEHDAFAAAAARGIHINNPHNRL